MRLHTQSLGSVPLECRCSFLEIYKEKIMDLLNPTTLDLSIREDITRGIYVENLTEQPVSSTAEVPALGSVCSPPQMTVSSHVLSAIASGTRGSLG